MSKSIQIASTVCANNSWGLCGQTQGRKCAFRPLSSWQIAGGCGEELGEWDATTELSREEWIGLFDSFSLCEPLGGSLRHTLRIRFCNHCTNSSARRIFRAHSTWNTLRRTKAKEESLERGTRPAVFEIQPFPTESEGEAFARYSQRLRFEPALWNSVNGGIRTCSVWHNGTIVVQSTVPYVGRVMARKSDPQTSFLDLL